MMIKLTMSINPFVCRKVRVFALRNNKFSGFMSFKPAFEIDLDLIKKFKVIFQFDSSNSSSYNFEVEAKFDPGSMLFELNSHYTKGKFFRFKKKN